MPSALWLCRARWRLGIGETVGRRSHPGAAIPPLGSLADRLPAGRFHGLHWSELRHAGRQGLQLFSAGEARSRPGFLLGRRRNVADGGAGRMVGAQLGESPWRAGHTGRGGRLCGRFLRREFGARVGLEGSRFHHRGRQAVLPASKGTRSCSSTIPPARTARRPRGKWRS